MGSFCLPSPVVRERFDVTFLHSDTKLLKEMVCYCLFMGCHKPKGMLLTSTPLTRWRVQPYRWILCSNMLSLQLCSSFFSSPQQSHNLLVSEDSNGPPLRLCPCIELAPWQSFRLLEEGLLNMYPPSLGSNTILN